MDVVGFVNGKIYTRFNPKKIVNALVVVNERVVYAGENEKAKEIVKFLNGEVVDLEGKTVLPGFIDSHMHLDELGMYLNMVDLRGVRSIKELKKKIGDYAEKAQTTWVIGHGWDQELFEEKSWPTRWDLDEVVKDRPVMLSRVCLHAGVLNTKAMKLTGLLEIDSPGVIKNEDGEPTGIVTEEAFELAREKFKETLTLEDYEKFFKNAMSFAASQGVTTVGFVSCDEKSIQGLSRLKEKVNFLIRVIVYLEPGRREVSNKGMYGNKDILESLKKLGTKRGFGDEKLKINGIKILADGSLGARTAWLSKPYSDEPSTSGYPNIDKKTLKELIKEAHEAGLQLAIHGIGDKTIDMILDAYENLGDIKNGRHRIEHASILRKDQIKRIARLGVVASVQPRFVITDWWAKSRVGDERVKWIYPFKSMLENDVSIGFGTDCPVEVLNPWETVYAAVTRGKYENVPYYEDSKEECLTLEEALYAYTFGSAYIMFEEVNLGTLEERKLADFIVVDRDPFEVEENGLKGIKILETYVGGKRVF